MSKFFNLLLISLIFYSCSSKRSVLYIQDSKDTAEIDFKYEKVVIKPNDILDIKILSTNDIAMNLYQSNKDGLQNIEVLKIQGYTVDNDGYVNLYPIGKVNLLNLTVLEAESKIYNIFAEENINQLINHNVRVKIINSNVTILGEVNRPGTYDYIDEQMNINKALGLAGDLTITGKREDIKLLRHDGTKTNIHSIDLTTIDYLDSDLFQIKSGDIIIVNPNLTKVKSAGIIGNSGTLISIFSFILSSLILITNN